MNAVRGTSGSSTPPCCCWLATGAAMPGRAPAWASGVAWRLGGEVRGLFGPRLALANAQAAGAKVLLLGCVRRRTRAVQGAGGWARHGAGNDCPLCLKICSAGSWYSRMLIVPTWYSRMLSPPALAVSCRDDSASAAGGSKLAGRTLGVGTACGFAGGAGWLTVTGVPLGAMTGGSSAVAFGACSS